QATTKDVSKTTTTRTFLLLAPPLSRPPSPALFPYATLFRSLDGGDSITDGTLSNAGTLDATGTNALHHVGITNTNNLESTGGVQTINANITIPNTCTLHISCGERDHYSDTVTNTETLKATNS